jgi:HK97 gp10 family phage protein
LFYSKLQNVAITPNSYRLVTRVVTNSIDTINKQIQAKVDGITESTAQEIASIARQLAPKGKTKRKRKGLPLWQTIVAGKVDKVWKVRVSAPYAGFVEYGTVHQAAQPFLRPAINHVKTRFARRVGQMQAGLGARLGQSTRIQRF